jgi:transcription antitermination protein NusB
VPARRRSRQRALQILFLRDVSKQPIADAMAAYDEILYSDEDKVRPQRDDFLDSLVKGVAEHIAEIDRLISQHAAHWRIERMPAVDRNILRLAVHEMMAFDTPPVVVIDEALELARKFSGEESVQFVNGVLDAVHKEIAKPQVNADERG